MKSWKEKSIGERLKYARESFAQLSQVQLAERAGVLQQTISNLESGKQDKSTDTVALATALGIFPEWLHNGTEPMAKIYSSDTSIDHVVKVMQEMSPEVRAQAMKEVDSIAEFAKKLLSSDDKISVIPPAKATQ